MHVHKNIFIDGLLIRCVEGQLNQYLLSRALVVDP
jgi:hypothetical protein